MGIALGSNFTVNTALPLDDRITFVDLTARDALAALRRYEGLVVYVESDGKNYQLVGGITNLDWQELRGGGGAGISSPSWDGDTNLPLRGFTAGLKTLLFDNTFTNEIYSQLIKVPETYEPGVQIRLTSGLFYSLDTTGNYLLQAITFLVKAGSVVGSLTDTHASVNAQASVPGVSGTLTAVGTIDLTDGTGQINAVAVAPGDSILIKLFRDPTDETSPAANCFLLEDSFQLAFEA